MICVLCVDDEPSVLVTLQYALGEKFRIITATNGSDALELLCHEPIDVLVTDQRMPGMDGAQLCAKALEVCPHIPRILLSAYHDYDDLFRALNDGGIVAAVPKPFDAEKLCDHITRLASQRGQTMLPPPPEPTLLERFVAWLSKPIAVPDREEIARKLASDPPLPIQFAEVSGAIDCALERLDVTFTAANHDLRRAAKRLSEESKQQVNRATVPPETT